MKNHTIIFLLVLLSGCNKLQKKETTAILSNSQETSDLSAKHVIENLSENLRNGDKVNFVFNLTMEHFVRIDSIYVVKDGEALFISATNSEMILDLDNDFKNHFTHKIRYNKKPYDSLSLECLFSKNMKRISKKNAQTYTSKIYTSSDTLTLYTYNLADKVSFLKAYFKTMKEIFPKEKQFEYWNQISIE